MAKYDTDDTAKPGKTPRVRRFPWRLWLYAIAMTAGAGAAAYYGWGFRQNAKAAEEKAASCKPQIDEATKKADEATKKASEADKRYTGCTNLLADNNKKAAEQGIQLTALSNNLSASKEEMAALMAQHAEAEKRLAAIADLQKQFAKMIDTGQLKVTARRGSLVLSLPSEVLFPSGVAELSEPGKMSVLEVGFNLKRLSDRRFLIVGHTDDQPLKSSSYKDNWELSTARALTVTRVLVQAGMDPKSLIAAGAGEHDPVSKDRAKNRRIEIALLPTINELPPLPASLGDDTAAATKSAVPAEAPAPESARPGAAKPAAPSPARP